MTGISPQVLQTRAAYVAARLLLLLAARGSADALMAAAAPLAANAKRRVLLLPVLRLVHDGARPTAERIAAMLPQHPAVAWALRGDPGEVDAEALAGLGDPLSVEEVVPLLQAMQAAAPEG